MSFSGGKHQELQECNLDYLLVNLGRNHAGAIRLIRLFIENEPQLVARLDTAAANGDLPALQDVVHDIRSSCVLFSAHRAVNLARELELTLHQYAGSGPNGIDWTTSIAPLRASLQRIISELTAYLVEAGE